MPRKPNAPQDTPAAASAPATAKAGTGEIFRKPKDDRRSALTHEKIADDLVAFQRAGGKIEVLGNTLTLKSIRPPETPAVAASGKDRKAAPAATAK